MLVYLAKYNLPLLNIDKNLNLDFELKCEKIYNIKLSTIPENICKELPEEFTEYLKYTRNLNLNKNLIIII